MLEGKKILIGITGSIAAYKIISLVRLLVKEGAEVRVVITPAALDFVSPLTLSTLSRNPVLSDLSEENNWANHVALGRWADIFLIAPLSANTLAKMANGLCDNLLLAVYLSATCPVMAAPAMDEDMWHHPATVSNLQKIGSNGVTVLPVAKGELASGLFGDGRMAEPEDMLQLIISRLDTDLSLQGKKVLVTAGPTYEPIDPVRFIGNHSSGKMGIALAQEFERRGARVTLVAGPSVKLASAGIRVVPVSTAAEMYKACEQVFEDMDITVMAAAVADYTPVHPEKEKIKKTVGHLTLELTRTTDILKSLGERKRNDQLLVGFALETSEGREHALDKLARKNADMIVLNSLADAGAGFGTDTNKVTLFTRKGQEIRFDIKSKAAVARDIIDQIITLYA